MHNGITESVDVLSQSSPLMGCRAVTVPGSGTWGLVWPWPNLWGCTWATLGVADVGAGTGVTLGTAGVYGFGVAGAMGAMVGGCSSCAGLVGAGSWCGNARSGRSLWCG